MVGHDQPGGEIIAAVENDVDAIDQGSSIHRAEPVRVRFDRDAGVESTRRGGGRRCLWRTDIARRENRLTLQVRQVDPVVVDQRQSPDTRGGEILDRGRADPARTDHRDMRGL